MSATIRLKNDPEIQFTINFAYTAPNTKVHHYVYVPTVAVPTVPTALCCTFTVLWY